ncbi:hypothetical protein J2S00_000741 [Caldalkalibacillus uzonensis]|uniref:DUF1468 domain-containing protein n=1 Tax=Caldalkalibacillus uzonensis TaxID=353224 RepID=A0ABU0CNG3_9BACI|nr:tripartite tricarboxylate transporter TctB family protein [Caldalkalibacillus uzonensis]MDQ0337958.1 hypothetical protein [Caldalkalibacillus uzonensis]
MHDRERKKDMIVALIVLGLSIAFYINTKTLTPPADIFPKAVILILFVLGSILLAKALFFNRYYHDEPDDPGATDEKGNIKKGWISMSALIAYVVLMPQIGFYTTSALFLILISWYLNGLRVNMKALLYPVIVSSTVMFIIYLAFSIFLRVPVPKGLVI